MNNQPNSSLGDLFEDDADQNLSGRYRELQPDAAEAEIRVRLDSIKEQVERLDESRNVSQEVLEEVVSL